MLADRIWIKLKKKIQMQVKYIFLKMISVILSSHYLADVYPSVHLSDDEL